MANDGAFYDHLGYSVAISGDTALLGAYRDDDNGSDSGSAYVFVRNGTGWVQMAKLVADDGAAGDRFGRSVAIMDDTALVGALGDCDNGYTSGSAYVFVRNVTRWVQTAKLLANDGTDYDYFGWSVAISGDTALVGAYGDDDNGSASGSAYVFNRIHDGGWVQTAKLLANDGTDYDYFGASVSISGDTALVGAYGYDDNGSVSGSAYVFVHNGTGWVQMTKLLANDGTDYNYFGWSVAISGDTVVVGAYGDDKRGRDSGSAYVFVRTHGDGWVQMAKLLANDGKAVDMFGYSVAISGDTALVGAVHGDDENISNIGSAYLFVRNDTGWAQTSKLVPHNGTEYDYFGFNVAIGGDSVVVGAYGDGDNGLASGAGYIYDIISVCLFEQMFIV